MTKRGVSVHWRLAEEIADLAQEHKVKWNRMVNVLVEFGIPTFQKFARTSPALIHNLLTNRYTYLDRERASDKIEKFSAKQLRGFKLDDRLAMAMPAKAKAAIRAEAKHRRQSMSQVARQRLGMKF